MNILFFSRLFYPHVGGVETHVEKVALELIKKSHFVTIVTERFDNKLPAKEIYKGMVIYRISISTSEKSAKGRSSSGRKKFEIWNWIWKHDYLLGEADIIHAHDVAFWFFPFRFVYLFTKFYTTFHGYETVFPPKKSAIGIRRLSKLMSNQTINVGDYIEKWYGTKADMVLYGGVDPIQNSKFKIQNFNSKFKILFIGRIESDNGIEVYARVLKLLKEKKVAFEFEAIGDGSKRKIFEKFGRVYGFVKNADKYIQNTDIVFASSYLSIMQALNAKKPVVATYSNTLKKDYLELSPMKKFIVIENNPENIVSHILNNSLKNTQNGYNWAASQSWEKVALAYELLWQK